MGEDKLQYIFNEGIISKIIEHLKEIKKRSQTIQSI
jgi:hypothetical protein